MRTKFLWLTIFLAVILFGFESVKACSCRVSPYLDERFADSKNIFVGTIEETTKTNERGVEKFKITVVENIKGELPQEVFAYYNNYDTCPDFYFRKGKTYLIFGNKKENNTFYSFACSGTDLLENSKRKISFVRDLVLGKKTTAVFGTLKKYNYQERRKNTPLEKIKVVLSNSKGKKFETITNEKGDYLFQSLPFGKYKIEFNLPEGLLKKQDLSFEFTKAPFIYQFDHFAYADGRISGKVLNSDGTLKKNELIFIKSIDENLYLPLSDATTDENGNFIFYGLPNSKFTLYDYLPETFSHYNEPSSKTYYLGNTFDLKEAKIIFLNEGQHIDNTDFIFPPEPPQIKGMITDENGKTIEEADLFLQYSNSLSFWEKRMNDWKATFSFPIFEGYKYRIYAKIMYGKFKGLESEKIEISKSDIGKQIKLVIKTKL